ncbi:MAG: hypothetical protein ACREFD_16410 [Stellaceae bacterium]
MLDSLDWPVTLILGVVAHVRTWSASATKAAQHIGHDDDIDAFRLIDDGRRRRTVEGYEKIWHNLAHGTRKAQNIGESPGTSKTLMKNVKMEKQNDFKRPKLASQAYDEGSIPFTRSKQINKLA